jgi:hypothetical protein
MLSELTARTGVEPAEGSHNMGDSHVLKNRGVWKKTVWKVCSTCSRTATLEEHFEDIVEQLPAKKLRAPGVLPDASEVYISIGVFSDAQIPTADLTLRCLSISESYGAAIEVCLYESDMSKASSEAPENP